MQHSSPPSPPPLLQLALDHTHWHQAQQDVNRLGSHVDIIEAGTILCLAEGLTVIRQLRACCPDKIIVADWKVADAGALLAHQALDAGANWLTVICAASQATVARAQAVACQHNGEIQIELFGNWTLTDAKGWRACGVRQAIYHRSRDAEASGQRWGQTDIQRMQSLSELGFELSITGGLTPEDIPLFRDIAVRAFIAGRALTDASDGVAVAEAFHQQIRTHWGTYHAS